MTTLLIMIGCAIILWLVSLQLKDASIADLIWGIWFVIEAWITHLTIPTTRSLIMLFLTSIWGLRLSLYLGWRNHGQPEDRRYQAMRSNHGQHFWWRSLFTVFLFQMLIAWLVGMPQRFGSTATPLGLLDWIGLSFFCIGLFFEVVGDWQLSQFLKDGNTDGVLCKGVWKYTRHPNYFGDALLWWGFGLLGFSATGTWWILLSPFLMTALLLKVSGVSMLERTIQSRRPKYQDYIERTSAFIPWFPKQ